jgi:hypothetical protein
VSQAGVDAPARLAESVEIAAAPEAVYRVVSDVTRLPEWAAETVRCRWLGSATGPVVGARFRGVNRRGPVRWSTTCTVTAAEPGRAFAFRVALAGLIPVAEWRYDLEPAGEGCRVTESTLDLRPRGTRLVTSTVIGVRDRPAHNRANMRRTLDQLKRHLAG